MQKLGQFTLVLVLAFVSMPINGYVFSLLWGWFMVPMFSLPPLGVAQSLALGLISGYLTHQTKITEEDRNKAFEDMVIEYISTMIIAKPLTYLLLGWVVSCFV